MTKFCFIFIFCVFKTLLFAQFIYSGKWQGIIVKNDTNWEKGNPIYFEFEIINNLLDGKSRIEYYSTNQFQVHKLAGKLDSNRYLTILQKKNLTEKTKSTNSCLRSFNLKYDFDDGYLRGTYSSNCPDEKGKIILYKSNIDFNDKSDPLQDHSWFNRFTNDLKKGLSSPEFRLIELRDFKFNPVFFEYDKFEIKSEYHEYLRNMIKMIQSHSDLRIKITGHTDADGDEKYNEKLSKNRANALILFFEKNGLDKSRVVIDFKGEKQPIDSNSNPVGKQKNRRVDFSFI